MLVLLSLLIEITSCLLKWNRYIDPKNKFRQGVIAVRVKVANADKTKESIHETSVS